MTPESDARLRAAFPLVFAGPLLNDEPIRCGEGWYLLLYMLCAGLEAVMYDELDVTKPVVAQRYRAVQVKEKFGQLRLYLDHETAAMTVLLGLAENLSKHVCDVCGAPGKLRTLTDNAPIAATRCDEHQAVMRRP